MPSCISFLKNLLTVNHFHWDFISCLFFSLLPSTTEHCMIFLKEKPVNTQHPTYYLVPPRKWEIKLTEPKLPGLSANHPDIKEILQRDVLVVFLKFQINETAVHSGLNKSIKTLTTISFFNLLNTINNIIEWMKFQSVDWTTTETVILNLVSPQNKVF